jgi:hypothetical protein
MQNMQRNAFKLMQNGLYMSFLQSECATITRQKQGALEVMSGEHLFGQMKQFHDWK